jgi:hypothetical protein
MFVTARSVAAVTWKTRNFGSRITLLDKLILGASLIHDPQSYANDVSPVRQHESEAVTSCGSTRKNCELCLSSAVSLHRVSISLLDNQLRNEIEQERENQRRTEGLSADSLLRVCG